MVSTYNISVEESERLPQMWNDLKRILAIYKRSELISVSEKFGYNCYYFNGSYKDTLVNMLGRDPTEHEILMLVDTGTSYVGCGAICTVDKKNRTFSGKVNTD